MYIRKEYIFDDLFNVLTVVPSSSDMNKKFDIYFYICELNVWHNRSGHMNVESLWKFVQLNYFQKLNFYNNDKCYICVEAKLSKHSFLSIKKSKRSKKSIKQQD